MFITKCTGSNTSLQAFPNLTITQVKAFLLISNSLNKVLTRERIALTLGVSIGYVDVILRLLKKEGLLSWTRRLDRYNDHNHYTITPLGQIWMPYLKNTYKVRTGIFKRAMLSIALLISPALSEYSLLREDYIYNPPLKRELQTRVRAKKAKMTMPINCKVLETAKELLSLSKWGVIRLTAYPTKAIEHTIAAFRVSKSKKDDPFKWFCRVCEEWCMDNNTEPDWDGARLLAKEQSMPKNPEWTVEREPLAIPGTPKKWKPKVTEQIATKSEEEVFTSKVQTLDKFKQMGELNEFQRIVQANLMKQVVAFMEKVE